jgi:hypothetical protein
METMSNHSDNETNDSMENEAREHARALLRAYQPRLHALKLQAARFGDHTPPHVLTEIDDIRVKIDELEAELKATTPATTLSNLRQLQL